MTAYYVLVARHNGISYVAYYCALQYLVFGKTVDELYDLRRSVLIDPHFRNCDIVCNHDSQDLPYIRIIGTSDCGNRITTPFLQFTHLVIFLGPYRKVLWLISIQMARVNGRCQWTEAMFEVNRHPPYLDND